MNSAAFQPRKAAPCRFFLADGTCLYGDGCQFSHELPPNNYGSANPGNGARFPSTGGYGDSRGNFFMNNQFSTPPPFAPKSSAFGEVYSQAGPVQPHVADSSASQQFPPSSGMETYPIAEAIGGLAITDPQVHYSASDKDMMPPPGGMYEFVPKSSTPAPVANMGLTHANSTPSFHNYSPYKGHPPNHFSRLTGSPNLSPAASPMSNGHHKASESIASANTSSISPVGHIVESVNGTMYFYSPHEVSNNVMPTMQVRDRPSTEEAHVEEKILNMPNFSVYAGPPPHVAHLKSKSGPPFGAPDSLKLEILNNQAMMLAQVDPHQHTDLPAEVDSYHHLVPLEGATTQPLPSSQALGVPTTVYKAVSMRDGLVYCLRRVHGFRLSNTKCTGPIDQWKKTLHPNVVQLREVFTTKAFADNSMIFVYDYLPGAETMTQRQLRARPQHQMNGYNNPFNLDRQAMPYSAAKARMTANFIQEPLLWSYIIQLTSALRAVHSNNLACRSLAPSKVLFTSQNRLWLNCCGIVDVVTFDTTQPVVQQHQQEDLVSLGRLLICLACNTMLASQPEHIDTSMDLIARTYSPDFKTLIGYLLGPQSRIKSLNEVMPMIGARFYQNLDMAWQRYDKLHDELWKEVQNARLFKLLCKMGSINERPEDRSKIKHRMNLDAEWSETGDRYMLKLFRDFLFHQVDESGAPWLDMAHIVQCLNKLDSGSPEKVVLMSRDEQNLLVVTYADLKQCLDSSFSNLMTPANQSGLQ